MMRSAPQAAHATNANSNNATIPEGYGVAIPTNPHDLLLMIQKQHKKSTQKINKQSDVVGRAQKQEKQREIYENKLMEFEDFIYKPEAADRLNRQFEHMRMEMEDELSLQMILVERNKKKLDFKEQVRLEVEERLRKEELERIARQKAAEDRRAAVVERLRKKAEEEESRRQEAEAALLRIEQEGLRREQEARDRLANDRSSMILEEELSRLAEADFKEQQERFLWERREKEKLAEYERELQAKDVKEAELRKARMAALEEKKARLAELKRLQNLAGSGQDGAADQAKSLQSTREQAAKLDKQLRIQNKAKFVTKKIQNNVNSSNEAVVVNDPSLALCDEGSTAAVVSNATSKTNTVTVAAADHQSFAGVTQAHAPATMAVSIVSSAALSDEVNKRNNEETEFTAYISAVEGEVELKRVQRDLMAEKRALRLEQKQRLASHNKGAGAQDPAEIEHAKHLRRRIAEIGSKEGIVQRRIQELLSTSQVATNGVAAAAGSAAEYARASKSATAASSAELLSLRALDPSSVTTESSSTAGHAGIATGIAGNNKDDQAQLYSQAEQMLREGQHLLQWLKGKQVESSESLSQTHSSPCAGSRQQAPPSLGGINKSFGRSFMFVQSDDASMQHRATLLTLETAQLAKDIDRTRDPANYCESLLELSKSLKTALSAFQNNLTPVSKVSAVTIVKHPDAHSTIVPSGSTGSLPAAEVKTTDTKDSLHSSLSDNALKPSLHAHQHQHEYQLQQPSSTAQQAATIPAIGGVPAKPESKQISETSVNSYVEESKGEIPNQKPNAVITTQFDLTAVAAAAVSSVTDTVDQVLNKEDAVEADEEGGEVGGEDREEGEEQLENFAELPGWEECLTTSMASAAHHAAFYGYIEVLDCLCKYFDCFVMDKKGRTPLFYAALQNRLNCVASLVSLDSQWIDVGDQNGDTSLHAAAIANGVEVLSFLLQCEANPDTANYAGLTPCHLARTQIALEALCEAGAMPYCVDSKSRMPLWFACHEGRADCVEYLCEKTPQEYLLWPDDEGETCLHRAAMAGHANCIEALAQHLPTVEELYSVNKKQHTAAHVAGSAGVLKALYENGANLWTSDPKGRMPLFTASFFGRTDCIAFLLDVASNSNSVSSKLPTPAKGKKPTDDRSLIATADFQGDTALHVACLCGHVRCVSLLLFFTPCLRNKQGLTPDQLATKAGHTQIAAMVTYVNSRREGEESLSSMQIFGCEFSVLSAVTLYYGSRWAKLYDVSFDTVYYLDRATGQSQWERPDFFDEAAADETATDKARTVLHRFYSQYNPDKLGSMNDILIAYRGKYTELFISLANKYNVQDLSMFEGISLD